VGRIGLEPFKAYVYGSHQASRDRDGQLAVA
jgi:hypothetical protein